MTDLDERETTRNLAAQRLRATDNGIQSAVYGPNPTAETMIIDHRDGTLYRYQAPTFTPLGHGPDAWVLDEFQHPPTAPAASPPDTEPDAAFAACGCCSYEETPLGGTGKRRRTSPWVTGFAAGALAGVAVYSGLVLAAWAVLR